MENKIDWHLFHRLDQGLLIDRLSSALGAFKDLGLVSQSNTDDFRTDIQTVQQSILKEDESVLTLLFHNNSNFIDILRFRYGAVGLSLNIARMSIKPQIIDLRRTIAMFGVDLLKKSQLLFNRSIKIHAGGAFQRQTLLSSVIVDLCEVIRVALDKLDQCEHLLNSMLPSDVAPYTAKDETIDLALAKAWGFAEVKADPTPFLIEKKVNFLLSQSCHLLAEHILQFISLCQSNNLKLVKPTVAPTCEWLIAEASRLTHMTFPDTSDLEAWELRRHNYTSSIVLIRDTFERVATDTLSKMVISAMLVNEGIVFSNAQLRGVVSNLVVQGLHIKEAKIAASKLRHYCVSNKTPPEKILDMEFARIHPQLSKSCIGRTDAMNDAIPSKAEPSTREKEKLVKKVTQLRDIFDKSIHSIAMIACLIVSGLFNSACGWRTPVQSLEPELRPAIPFDEGVMLDESRMPIEGAKEPKKKQKAETPPIEGLAPGKPQ